MVLSVLCSWIELGVRIELQPENIIDLSYYCLCNVLHQFFYMEVQ